MTFIALLLLSLHAEGSSLDLTNWVGKYPHDTDKDGLTLFQVPAVHAALSHLLKRREMKLLTKTYIVSSRISLIQGFLVVQRCMPHCCPCAHVMLAIDLKDGRFHIGFYDHKSERVTIKWISSEGEFQNLPKEIQDEFYHGHNPR